MSKAAFMEEKISFGKHKGELWARVPMEYLRWLMKAGWSDAVKGCAQSHYHRRRFGRETSPAPPWVDYEDRGPGSDNPDMP